MNAATDRDLTFEEQEQLSGGLFFVDDLPAEFADQFRMTCRHHKLGRPFIPLGERPGLFLSSGRVNPTPLGTIERNSLTIAIARPLRTSRCQCVGCRQAGIDHATFRSGRDTNCYPSSTGSS